MFLIGALIYPIIGIILTSCIVGSFALIIVRKKSKKRLAIFLKSTVVCAIILLASIFYFTDKPIIYCPNQLKPLLTDSMKKDIRHYNNGVYSIDYPAFPVYIQVISIDDNKVAVRVNYSTFGTTEMEIDNGVPSTTKKMFGWL